MFFQMSDDAPSEARLMSSRLKNSGDVRVHVVAAGVAGVLLVDTVPALRVVPHDEVRLLEGRGERRRGVLIGVSATGCLAKNCLGDLLAGRLIRQVANTGELLALGLVVFLLLVFLLLLLVLAAWSLLLLLGALGLALLDRSLNRLEVGTWSWLDFLVVLVLRDLLGLEVRVQLLIDFW